MTTQVQRHMIKVAVNAGKIELAVKLAILANLEGNGVFIDSAKASALAGGMTAHQFAGGLSALTQKGAYRPSQDPEYNGLYGYFKEV